MNDAAYVFASYGSLSGTFGTNITGLPAGYKIDYAYNDGTGSNHIALVPEPACLAGLLSLPAILLRRRRRRRSAAGG